MLYFEARKVRSLLQWILVPLLLGALLFFSHCNPPDRYQYHYPVSQETKDYCYFEEGSWWVYVDSNRMVYDTVVCVYNIEGNVPKDHYYEYPFESFANKFSSSFYKVEWLCQSGEIHEHDTLIYQDLIDFVNHPNIGFQTVYFSTHIDVDSLKFGDDITSFRKEINHLNGFVSVKTFKTSNTRNAKFNMIAWAPHVGIVYKAMPDGTHWELIDYEVLQP